MPLTDNITPYYQTLFQTSDIPMMIVTKEQLLDCNQAAICLFNADSKNDLLKYHPSDLLSEWDVKNPMSQAERTHPIKSLIKCLNTEPVLSHIRISSLEHKQSVFSVSIKPLSLNQAIEQSIDGVSTTNYVSTKVNCGPEAINTNTVQLTTTLLTDKKGADCNLLARSQDLNELQLSHQKLNTETARRAALAQLLNSSLNVQTEQQFIDESLDTLLSLPLSFLHNKGAFFLMQGDPAQLVMQASRNLSSELHTLCAKVPIGHCLCGRAAATGKIQFASCLDDRHDITFAGIQPHGHYNLPFFLDGKVEGVVVVYLKHGATFSQEDHDLLNAAGNILSSSLKRMRMESEIKRNNELLEYRISEQTIELRKNAELANAANIAKSRFLANMSHELRTPLHGILSFARFGLNKNIVNKPEKILKYFNRINTSGERLLRILNDLLDLAKLEAGQMTLENNKADLREVANTCITDQEAWMHERKLRISWDELSIISAPAYFDKLRISQVITNLLSNAIKFTPEGKALTAALFNDEFIINGVNTSALRFSLCDEGTGIMNNELEAVFDKFIQSSKVHSGTTGTGLGLAICKEIIDAHHGKIWAEHSPSGGSCFQFIIPCNH